jgi:nicotinamidase-related amidase
MAFQNPSWGRRNNPQAEQQIANLLAAWRKAGAPIIHVRHRSRKPEGLFRDSGREFKPEAMPVDGEPVIDKSANGAFIGTDLEQRLRQSGAQTIVIAGLTTDHCCSTTARIGSDLGFRVWFVADATATHERRGPDGALIDAETMHRTELASLSGEFAEIVEAKEAINRLQA